MGRVLAGGIVVAIIALMVFYTWSHRQAAERQNLQDQITALNQEVATLKDQNATLSSQLTKVQQEETRLATENDMLNRAIATAKATGTIPKDLPPVYPPK